MTVGRGRVRADGAAPRGRRPLVAAAAVLAVSGSVMVGMAVAAQRPGPAPAVAPAVVASAVPTAPAPTVPAPTVPARTTPPAPAATQRQALPVLAPSRPVRVAIPQLGLDTSRLVDLGLDGDGAMEVPRGPRPVGWFTGSPTPGERGPSVLAAHLVWNGVPGSFATLATLRPGQRVEVGRADGTTVAFEVTRVEQYGKQGFPAAEVYGNTDGPELRLITCAGDYDSGRSSYLDNVVVYARMAAVAGRAR